MILELMDGAWTPIASTRLPFDFSVKESERFRRAILAVHLEIMDESGALDEAIWHFALPAQVCLADGVHSLPVRLTNKLRRCP